MVERVETMVRYAHSVITRQGLFDNCPATVQRVLRCVRAELMHNPRAFVFGKRPYAEHMLPSVAYPFSVDADRVLGAPHRVRAIAKTVLSSGGTMERYHLALAELLEGSTLAACGVLIALGSDASNCMQMMLTTLPPERRWQVMGHTYFAPNSVALNYGARAGWHCVHVPTICAAGGRCQFLPSTATAVGCAVMPWALAPWPLFQKLANVLSIDRQHGAD